MMANKVGIYLGKLGGHREKSKRAQDMTAKRYVSLTFSEYMDLRQKMSDASLALSRLAQSLADIKWMCLPKKELVESLQKSTDTWDTKLSTPLPSKDLEPDAFGRSTGKTLKSTDSLLQGSKYGQTRKSHRR